jgi:hypothetical protein
MNACERIDSLLSAYIESETSPAETAFIDRHQVGCERCRGQIQGVRTVTELVNRLPRVSVADTFTERVLARTTGLPALPVTAPAIVELRARRPVWVLPLAAAAALAVVTLGVLQVDRFSGPGTELVATGPEVTPPLQRVVDAIPETHDPEPAVIPEMTSLGPETARPLGMVRDAYVLEAYELREPAGGGGAILTRVRADDADQVVVTF